MKLVVADSLGQGSPDHGLASSWPVGILLISLEGFHRWGPSPRCPGQGFSNFSSSATPSSWKPHPRPVQRHSWSHPSQMWWFSAFSSFIIIIIIILQAAFMLLRPRNHTFVMN